MTQPPRGDPKGRRLALRRAGLLAEARVVAIALNVLLRRADKKLDDPEMLIRQLATLEAIELQRAHGRIEPRRRFKGHPNRLVRQRPRSHLSIDECGKPFPEPKVRHDPGVFALAGVALPEEEVDNYKAAADEIKMRFFNDTDITFHEPDMREREGRYKFQDDEEAAQFDLAMDALVANTPFVAFGVAIRKTAFKDFVEAEIDPYLPTDAYSIAILLLLERYVDFLATSPVERLGRVTFEQQGKKEDAFHQLEYARHLCEGSQWISHDVFQDWVEPGLQFIPKSGSHPAELSGHVCTRPL
jgi:hypothetical protein